MFKSWQVKRTKTLHAKVVSSLYLTIYFSDKTGSPSSWWVRWKWRWGGCRSFSSWLLLSETVVTYCTFGFTRWLLYGCREASILLTFRIVFFCVVYILYINCKCLFSNWNTKCIHLFYKYGLRVLYSNSPKILDSNKIELEISLQNCFQASYSDPRL